MKGQPSVPRFASEEMGEEELTPLLESRKTSEPPVSSATEQQPMMESEPAPFILAPQPVLIDEAPEAPRSAPPSRMPIVHTNFDEPFEEEYARLIPSKPATEMSRAMTEGDGNRTESEPHMDNLDIPAFLRRPVN
jgi:hypothetical protein